MQVTETSSEGLKRKLKVVVPATELGQRFTARIDEVKDKVQLKGFRQGKVPVAHIKKVYGKGLMTEVVQEVDPRDQQPRRSRSARSAPRSFRTSRSSKAPRASRMSSMARPTSPTR